MMHSIIVTGAVGQVAGAGGRVVEALQRRGLPVRAMVSFPGSRGFYKTLVAADSDRILGFTAFAPEAGDVMTIVQLAMTAGLPYTALRDAILVHPTMAEGLARLFRALPAKALTPSADTY